MPALLQFAGLICMFTFLVVGADYMKSFDDRFIEMLGMALVAVGVFSSSLLFYLAHTLKLKEGAESESIISRHINKNIRIPKRLSFKRV